jgi:1,4-dihydroxy-2-naphthoate octaprenyltransferase
METESPREQAVCFLRHLRLGFQLAVAPAAYLLGVVFSARQDVAQIAVQFVNVHVLLLGGASAYNSFYDRDRGPVEGLRSPPRMRAWMRLAALWLQGLGAIVAFLCNWLSGVIYLFSILGFSLAYSNPAVRLKGKPVGSLFVIGTFGALTPFALGFLASGGGGVRLEVLLAALGIGLIVVATFPLAQAHQIAEDQDRGDLTFTVRFGMRGVRRLFAVAFPAGTVLIAAAFATASLPLAASVLLLGAISGWLMARPLGRLEGSLADYEELTRLKAASALCFNAFLLLLVLRK